MKIGVSLDDDVLSRNIGAAIEDLPSYGSGSLGHMLPNLTSEFSEENVLIYSPDRILSNTFPLRISAGRIVENDSPVGDIDVLVSWAINSQRESFSFEYVKRLAEALSQKEGVGKVINSPNTLVDLDKRSLYDVIEHSVLPKMFEVSTKSELTDLVNDQSVVLKHIRGAEGSQVHLVDASNVKNLGDVDYTEFMVQAYEEIRIEKRFVVYGDQIVGGRMWSDRIPPWVGGPNGIAPGVIKSGYEASETESKIVLDAHKKLGLDYSAIDTIETANGSNLILEVNTVCPGLVSPNYPNEETFAYRLGINFATYLRSLE